MLEGFAYKSGMIELHRAPFALHFHRTCIKINAFSIKKVSPIHAMKVDGQWSCEVHPQRLPNVALLEFHMHFIGRHALCVLRESCWVLLMTLLSKSVLSFSSSIISILFFWHLYFAWSTYGSCNELNEFVDRSLQSQLAKPPLVTDTGRVRHERGEMQSALVAAVRVPPWSVSLLLSTWLPLYCTTLY